MRQTTGDGPVMSYELDSKSAEYKTIMDVEALSIRGNIVPPGWHHHLRTPGNKSYFLAIHILADVVYWYRPVIDRDESTGQVLLPRKKFRGDKLQRSYDYYTSMFLCSKKDAQRACHYLRDEELIGLEFRTVSFVSNGITKLANNVMFIGLNVQEVARISVPK